MEKHPSQKVSKPIDIVTRCDYSKNGCHGTKHVEVGTVRRLLELRTAMNLTQRQVAAAVGISRSSYAMIENGERTPRPQVMKRLAAFYGTTVDALFFEEPSHTVRQVSSPGAG